MKNPHREAYRENGGILGKPKPPKHACVSCKKLIGKKDMFIANDEGRRWHYRCVTRSEAVREFAREALRSRPESPGDAAEQDKGAAGSEWASQAEHICALEIEAQENLEAAGKYAAENARLTERVSAAETAMEESHALNKSLERESISLTEENARLREAIHAFVGALTMVEKRNMSANTFRELEGLYRTSESRRESSADRPQSSARQGSALLQLQTGGAMTNRGRAEQVIACEFTSTEDAWEDHPTLLGAIEQALNDAEARGYARGREERLDKHIGKSTSAAPSTEKEKK